MFRVLWWWAGGGAIGGCPKKSPGTHVLGQGVEIGEKGSMGPDRPSLGYFSQSSRTLGPLCGTLLGAILCEMDLRKA